LENVKVMPLQAERAIQAAQRAARGETGSLKVGFTSSAPFNPVVTSAIRSFRRAYPDLVGSAGLFRPVSPAPDTRLIGKAPVGHRLPHAGDVPPENDLEHISAGDAAVDRKINNICRGR
jgi:hypothetical protein